MANRGYTRKEYTIAEIAYLAGIVDGEGSIYIGNFSCSPKTGAKYYQTNIEVTNSSKPMIDWLQKTFGGAIHAYTPSQRAGNSRKPYWRWIATGDRVTHLSELILPYLTAKIDKCKIMIKMRATYPGNCNTHYERGKQGTQNLSEDLLSLRQSYMDEMQSLHIRNYSA